MLFHCIPFAVSAVLALPGLPVDTIVIETVEVGDPGNPAAPIVPFNPEFPGQTSAKAFVGRVDYVYEIGRYEITVEQYVKFLNAVDRGGGDVQQLWFPLMDPVTNPYRGQVARDLSQPAGQRFSIAAAVWASKPIAYIDFFRAARFVNALHNGQHVRTRLAPGVFRYECQFSSVTDVGVYDLRLQTSYGSYTTRQAVRDFVLPSQDEWVKAAYYSKDPVASGRNYWRYPTRTDFAPVPATTDACGNVTNAVGNYAVANYGNAAVWCPSTCASGGADPCTPPSTPGNLTDVGACGSPSPWGTYDQGGNVVEWTDTIVQPPADAPNPLEQCIWRQVHGGIAVAGDYQLWLSATGASDPYGQALGSTNEFGGFRVGMLPGADPADPDSCAADLNHDGVVDGEDLAILLAHWGICI